MLRQDLYQIAHDAYFYAYPIVTMDVTKRAMTKVPSATAKPMHAPVNQFAHVREYPPAEAKSVVRPNFDTLYSVAWVDVEREPMVLSVPDTKGRYYLIEMLDMWTDVFAVVGKRTTGTGKGDYALVSSEFHGSRAFRSRAKSARDFHRCGERRVQLLVAEIDSIRL